MKEFLTLFAINGKLLPGFNAAFGGAKKQITDVGRSANQVGAAFAKLGKQLLALGVAYLGWKGISTFFRDASAVAERNAALNFKLLNTLKAQKGMQVAGVLNYQNQYNKLVALSKELGKQGVLSAGNYKTAMATMATYGLAPNKIQKISKSLGDVAVQQHGVNVTSEQMEGLAQRWSNAIVRGNIRGLGPLVGHMTNAEREAWKTGNQTRRIQILLRAAERAAKDFNAEAAKTPEGKMRTFVNQWNSFLGEIGERLRPFHGEMAGIKSQILGAFGPTALAAVKGFTEIFRLQTDEFADWDPELKGLFDDVSEFSKAIGELGDAFEKLGGALGVDFAGAAGGLGKLFASELIRGIKDFADALNILANAVDRIKGIFGSFEKFDAAVMTWRQSLGFTLPGKKAAEAPEPITRTFGRIERASYEQGGLLAAALPKQAVSPEALKIEQIQRDQIPTLQALEKIYNDNLTAQGQATEEYKAGMTTAQEVRNANQRVNDSQLMLEQALSATSTAAGFSAEEIQKLGGGVDAVIQALQQKAAQLAAINIQIPTLAAPAAVPAPAAMQEGGLVSKPTYAMLGESGAEMVLPLQRSRRGLSLLEAAAKSMGVAIPGWATGALEGAGGPNQLGRAMEELFSRIRGNASSTAARASGPMNYAPTLNFGSGAEPGMVTLARNMLRSTAGEFFDRYEEAFDESRRLAFE